MGGKQWFGNRGLVQKTQRRQFSKLSVGLFNRKIVKVFRITNLQKYISKLHTQYWLNTRDMIIFNEHVNDDINRGQG